MAVITLPQDTRWGDLGKGLGGLLGNVISNIQDQRVSTGVSQIMNDPQFAGDPAKMLGEVSKQYGGPGIKKLTEIQDNLIKIGNLQKIAAETGLDRQRATQIAQDVEIKGEQKPDILAQARANVKATETATALGAARTSDVLAGVPGTVAKSTVAQEEQKADIAGATVARTGAAADKDRAAASFDAARTAQIDARVKMYQSLFSPVNPQDKNSPLVIDKMATDLGITDPNDIARVRNEATLNPDNPGAAARSAIDKILADRQKLSERMPPSDIRKLTDQASAGISTLSPFMEPGEKLGYTGGVRAWLEKKGFNTSDPGMMASAIAGEQNMAHFAESGAGFGGAWRTKLGADVTPQPFHTRMWNVLATGQIAQQEINRLTNAKNQMAAARYSTEQIKPLQDQIDSYQRLLDNANSLWWAYDGQDGKGNGTGKVHFYYRGQEVDQGTLRPLGTNTLADPSMRYRMADNRVLSAADINDTARKAGLTPQAMLTMDGAVPVGR